MTEPNEPQSSTLGGTLGGKSARLIADAVAYTRARMGPQQERLALRVFTEATNHVSDEVRQVMGPLWRQLANDPNTPPELKALFHSLATKRGQAWAWIGGAATSAMMAGGLMEVLANMLRPTTLPLIRLNPTAPLDPQTAAAAEARGLGRGFDPREDAASNGINGARYNTILEMARGYPTVDELRHMLNRGDATLQQATDVMQRLGIHVNWYMRMLDLRKMPLTPEQLAAMWNRSIVTTEQGRAIARQSGMAPEDFDRLTLLGGEPLSPQELGEAYRRGFIDKGRFNRGIVQGPIRNEWFDVIERLQYGRMSPVEAADAINQGHMSLPDGQDVAKAHGLDPDDFATLITAAGAPPGIEFMEEAYNRGLISDAEWERAFKESRIKNRYIPVMRAMRTRLIPTETARLMYREQVYTAAELVKTLRGHGFNQRDAEAQVALEDARRTEGTKELSRAQVLDLYEEDIVSDVDAANMLREIGYAADEVAWMMALAEVNKVRRFVNAAVSRVRASYLNGRIDLSEASNLLDEIGVTPQQRDRLTSIWDIERDTVSQQLTTAQIQSALKKGLIDDTGAYNRFIGRGYSPEDASILVTLAGGTPPAT